MTGRTTIFIRATAISTANAEGLHEAISITITMEDVRSIVNGLRFVIIGAIKG